MDPYADLIAALNERDLAYERLAPMQRKWHGANTTKMTGWLSGLVESFFDANRRKGMEDEYYGALSEAQGADSRVEAQRLAAERAFAEWQDAQKRAAEVANQDRESALRIREHADKARIDQQYAKPEKAPNDAQLWEWVQRLPPEQQKSAMSFLQNRGRQTTVQIPAPPQGHFYNDPSDPAAGVTPIPGSPAAEAQANADVGDAKKQYKSQSVIDTVDEALAGTTEWTAGPLGAILGNIPGTDALDLQATIDTLKSNLAFDQLQSMRDASKTGGALGQVSERELSLLESNVAQLNPKLAPEDLRRRLKKIRQHYMTAAYILENGALPPGYEGRKARAPAEMSDEEILEALKNR